MRYQRKPGGDLLSTTLVRVADPHPDPPPFRGRESAIHMSYSGVNIGRHPRGTLRPSFALLSSLTKSRALATLEGEGAGKAGCRLHPWVPCKQKSTGVGPQVSRTAPAFPARWFYGLLRALPGDRAFLSPSPVRCARDINCLMCGHRHQVNASVGASGPHDFAVRKFRRSSCAVTRVHRIPPQRS